MSKKEKVDIKRANDFAEVDDELSEALALLEQSNARVEAVLTGDHGEEGETEPTKSGATAEATALPEPSEDPAPAAVSEERDDDIEFDVDEFEEDEFDDDDEDDDEFDEDDDEEDDDGEEE